MDDFSLHVNGWKYSGWTALQVTRSMEQLAHSFSVALTDRWGEGDYSEIPVEAGDACAISYKSDWVTNGYVDDDSLGYDARSHTVEFDGRSATGDLVDCAAVYQGGQWRNKGLLQIATDLCDPFEIEASSNVDLGGRFTLFEIQDGETVFQALERGARRRGVLMLTKADGGLIFDRVGSAKVRTKLEYGKNILRCQKRSSWRERFSQYTIKAQAQGSDTFFGAAASAISRSSSDDGISRYRPMVLVADDEDSGTELQKRADWERNVRAGRAKRVTYAVQGWEHEDGLWEPNTLVTVVDPVARIDDELLLVEVSHSRDEQSGSMTSLTLTFPEAFGVQPLPAPKKKKGALF